MKKVCKVLFIILILMVLLLPVQVKADSFKFNVTASKTNVKPGETVEVTFNISDIDAGELGINTLEGNLEYDTNIFEEVTANSIQLLNNWTITYNDEDTEHKGKFLAFTAQGGVTEKQNIGKITFKVKNGVQYTNTTIKIKNIASNNGHQLINETDKQITLEIGTKPQEQNTNTQQNQQSTNTQQNTEKVNIISNSASNKNNISPGVIPQTGNMDYIYFIIAGLFIVFAVGAYIKYKKINEKINK